MNPSDIKRKLPFYYWLIIISCILLLLFFFIKSQSNNKNELKLISLHITELINLNSQVNDALVQNHSGNTKHYDYLVAASDKLQFQSEIFYKKTKILTHKKLNPIWKKYETALKNKQLSLEQYKSHYAILKNSQAYFFLISQQLENKFQQLPAIDGLLNDFINIFHFINNNTKATLPNNKIKQQSTGKIKEIINKFHLTNKGDISLLLENLIIHAEIINRFTIEVNQMITLTHRTKTKELLDKIFQEFLIIYKQREESAQFYKKAILYVALFLAIAILLLFFRQNKILNKLSETIDALDFQQFALNQHAIVSETDVKGNITYVNDKFCQISGYSAKELLGKNHRIIKSDEHSTDVFKNMWRTIANGKVWHGQVKNLAKNGAFYWVEATIVPFLNKKGKPFRYISIRTEITQQKKMQEEIDENHQFLQSVTDAMGEGVYTIDQNGLCTSVNPEFEHLTGWKKEEVIGKNLHELIHFQTNEGIIVPEENCPTHLSIRDGKKCTSDDEYFTHKDGLIFPVSLISVPLYEDSKIIGSVSIFQNISIRKQAEAQLYNAKKLAEQANREKSDFLANMSHEIRTPMNAIIGMSYLALQTNLNEKQQNYIKKVHYSAESLLGIINDILDFSKIEAGKLELEQVNFNLSDVFENLSTLIGNKIEEKSLELLIDTNYDVPYTLIGDPLRLTQILLNLANNAVKFTEQGEIIVHTSIQKWEENEYEKQVKLKFSIQDSGIGMTIEQQEKLFQSFSQADSSTTRKYGGTGLGLVISKNLTELMGGRIWVDSQYQKGSTFSFTVVLGVQEPELQQTKSIELADINQIKGKRILIVDDNASAREILSSMSEHLNMNVCVVSNGQHAIDKVKDAIDSNKPFDLVLMDWKMPDLDGMQTVQKLYQNHSSMPPSVIMVTAYGKDGVSSEANKLDIKIPQILTKPITQSSLFDALITAFGFSSNHTTNRTNNKVQYLAKIKQLSGAKILLVEDNILNQELAIELLSNHNIIVTIANNGQEAIEWVTKESFDAVLMDIQMPIMDGYTATKKIREINTELVIIAMTANAMVKDQEQALDVGMNDYISKPIDVKEMFSTIAKWVKVKQIKQNDTNQQLLNTVNKEIVINFPQDFFNRVQFLDYENTLLRLDNDIDLYIKTLHKFSNEHYSDINILSDYLNMGDYDSAARCIHTLKGVTGNLGAESVFQSSKKLELCINNCQEKKITENCSLLISETQKLLDLTISEVQKLVNKRDTLNKENNLQTDIVTTLNDKQLLDKLEDILEQLMAYNTTSEEFIDSLLNLGVKPQINDRLIIVKQQVAKYDFETATIAVKELIDKLN